MIRRTFAELYCEMHGLSIDDYARVILRRGLYLHARPLAPLLNLFSSEYFAADRDFVEDVGRLRHYHEFIGCGLDFSHHPENRGFMRSVLRLRVSTEKMRVLVKSVLRAKDAELHEPDDKGTIEPFAQKNPDATGKAEQPGN